MSIIDQIQEEPVKFQGLIQATLAMVSGLGLLGLTQNQMGYVLAFTAALLTFLTRRVVTPTVNPKTNDGIPLVPADPAVTPP